VTAVTDPMKTGAVVGGYLLTIMLGIIIGTALSHMGMSDGQEMVAVCILAASAATVAGMVFKTMTRR